MRKRPFSLIEVLISLALASFLIGALLYALKSSIFIDFRASEIERDVLKRAAIQNRLDSLVFAAIRPQGLKGISYPESPFYLTDEYILSFTIDHGIDPDPNFCGPIKAFLQLDSGHALSISLEGKEEGTCRQEVLMQDVEEVAYAFLYQDEEGSYLESDHWDEELRDFPCAVKMTLRLCSKQVWDFVSWLSLYPQPILYSKPS